MFQKKVDFGPFRLCPGGQGPPTLGPSAGPKNENFKKIKGPGKYPKLPQNIKTATYIHTMASRLNP